MGNAWNLFDPEAKVSIADLADYLEGPTMEEILQPIWTRLGWEKDRQKDGIFIRKGGWKLDLVEGETFEDDLGQLRDIIIIWWSKGIDGIWRKVRLYADDFEDFLQIF